MIVGWIAVWVLRESRNTIAAAMKKLADAQAALKASVNSHWILPAISGEQRSPRTAAATGRSNAAMPQTASKLFENLMRTTHPSVI
ncbi:MAG: hypothetical protein K2H09_03450 [Treponemataceae bacterium]|nr:hypothetical protein [Treponemataceae bacterium]